MGPQNLHELHVSNVYQDAEFIKDVQTIFPDRERLLELTRQPDSSNTADEQIAKKCRTISDLDREKLAKKYAIEVGDVVWYLRTNNERSGEFYSSKRKPFRAIDRDEDTLTLMFNRNITKEDYLEAWNQWFMPSKSDISQPKLPIYDKLLYAIFKAREQRGETFRQIFEQYNRGKLPGYNGPNGMFADNQKKFEEYYRKYKI